MEKILFRMREIIMTIDLDNASCLEIRKQLESDFNVNLTPYKRFIDEQVFPVDLGLYICSRFCCLCSAVS